MQPSQDLVYKVRASFVSKGTTLNAFCRDNNIDRGNIYRYLRGDINTEKAILERDLVVKAAFKVSNK